MTYNKCSSNLGNIKSGVPHGSIMGPLLFLIYVNDLSRVSEHLSYILFADNTNIFATGKNVSEVVKLLNTELVYIYEWIETNRFSLNLSRLIIYKD